MKQFLEKYPDIYAEYQRWVASSPVAENRVFPPDGIRVEGFLAADIKKIQPRLTGEGVYRFLVDLREAPEEIKSYIDEGIPII